MNTNRNRKQKETSLINYVVPGLCPGLSDGCLVMLGSKLNGCLPDCKKDLQTKKIGLSHTNQAA